MHRLELNTVGMEENKDVVKKKVISSDNSNLEAQTQMNNDQSRPKQT